MDQDLPEDETDVELDDDLFVDAPLTEVTTREVRGGVSSLSTALNTSQNGRTFQDRSYVFRVASRPG